MKIGILGANESTIRELRKALTEYSIRRTVKIEIILFRSFKNFLNSVDEFDILFVDDYPNKRTSIETARIMRAEKHEETLILLSADPVRVYDAFEVKAHRFLLLPFTVTSIFEAVDAFRKEQMSNKCLLAKTDDGFQSFKIKDLLYITANGKYSTIHVKKKDIRTVTPYSQILDQLPGNRFDSCHRSYVVNLEFVKDVGPTTILMVDESSVPLSRRRKTDFLIHYSEFTKSKGFD